MIKYNKRITLERKRNGDIYIDTDRGDVYQTFQYNKTKHPVSDWWSDQNQSEIRHWQKDLVVAYAGDALGALTLFVINKRGQGYSQDHDMCLAYSEQHNVWVFSTQTDYWIVHSDAGQIVFDRSNSLGSVLDQTSRIEIGKIWDQLKARLNPENLCGWVRY
jgi:hypothetical protein